MKYSHPVILVLDTESEVPEALREEGFNVSVGSLGTPYKVVPQMKYSQVFREVELPKTYQESEIVIIDVHAGPLMERQWLQQEEVAPGVHCWWASHEVGAVNPRMLNGNLIASDFNRILLNGGVFIVFADQRSMSIFRWGADASRAGKELICSNWSFLTILDDGLSVGSDYGIDVRLEEGLPHSLPILRLLGTHVPTMEYDCTIEGPQSYDSLLQNKYGRSVGGVIPAVGGRTGWIFILPVIKDLSTFTTEFVKEVLPDLAPHLFPDFVATSWVDSPPYQMKTVRSLLAQMDEIRTQAQNKVNELEALISEEKSKNPFLFELLTGTGEDLVHAVRAALETLGFDKVFVMDEDESFVRGRSSKKEDLQIQDYDTTLLVEVKGVGGNISDDDALAVGKYVSIRMREWGHTAVQGLSIINCQRHLPPHDRDDDPYREEIVAAAEEQKIGLLTGWDLYRLTRSFIELGWQHNHIKDLLYQPGRILPIPAHYEYLGRVERYKEIEELSVVGVRIEQGELSRGDRISYQLPVVFEEQICDSLQVDNDPIECVGPDTLVGIKTHLSKGDAKAGTRVYRIRRDI